jgi:hypothetical protein
MVANLKVTTRVYHAQVGSQFEPRRQVQPSTLLHEMQRYSSAALETSRSQSKTRSITINQKTYDLQVIESVIKKEINSNVQEVLQQQDLEDR